MTDVEEQLIPGIPQDVTLTHIAPKLSWKDCHALASVSRTWQKAIQSRMVYNERIRSTATETLVVVKHLDDDVDKPVASLYSMREKKFYRLPPIPPSFRKICRFSNFLTSNGTLYVMTTRRGVVTTYRLDLTGQGQWEKCREDQSLPERPPSDGETCTYRCLSKRGDDIFVREGSSRWCQPDWIKYSVEGDIWFQIRLTRDCLLQLDKISPYSFSADEEGALSIREVGNYHHVGYDDHFTKIHTHLHAIPRRIEPAVGTISDPIDVEPLYILQLNNELLAIANWRDDALNDGYCMIQSRGFGSASREIVWERVPHPTSFLNGHTPFAMCPVQL